MQMLNIYLPSPSNGCLILGTIPGAWLSSLAEAAAAALPELSPWGKDELDPWEGVLAGDDVLPTLSVLGLRGTGSIMGTNVLLRREYLQNNFRHKVAKTLKCNDDD